MEELNGYLKAEKTKKNPFNLPDGYFDQLEEAVFEKINAGGLRKPAPVPVLSARKGGRWSRRYLWATAACISLLLAAWFLMRPVGPFSDAMAQSELSQEEAEAWLLENTIELDNEQLALLCEAESAGLTPEGSSTSFGDSIRVPANSFEEVPLEADDLDFLLNDMSEEELERIF
jgi:hypothetical protein